MPEENKNKIKLNRYNPVVDYAVYPIRKVNFAKLNLAWIFKSKGFNTHDWLSMLVGDILINNTLTTKTLCIGLAMNPYFIASQVYGATVHLLTELYDQDPESIPLDTPEESAEHIFKMAADKGMLLFENSKTTIRNVIGLIAIHDPDAVVIYGQDSITGRSTLPSVGEIITLHNFCKLSGIPVFGIGTTPRASIAVAGGRLNGIQYAHAVDKSDWPF